MVTDGRSAREELWRRYDAGTLGSAELDTRLALVDRAGDDDDALAGALDGPTPLGARCWSRRAFLGSAAAVAGLLLGFGVWWVVDDERAGDADGVNGNGLVESATTVLTPLPAPLPLPPGEAEAAAECPELEEEIERLTAAGGGDEVAANPALLSDPPALPEGYSVTDEDPIAPGTDANVAMQVNAGNPSPIEIVGRDLVGELLVTMRTFRYASAADADAAGRGVLGTAVCNYGMGHFDVPGRPEITGSVVSDVIPTTAFAGFRLAERRFTVAVPSASDDQADIEAAQALAGTIAGLELDAARTAPPG